MKKSYLIEISEVADDFETIGVLNNLLRIYAKDRVIKKFRVSELTAQKNNKEAEPSATPNKQSVPLCDKNSYDCRYFNCGACRHPKCIEE